MHIPLNTSSVLPPFLFLIYRSLTQFGQTVTSIASPGLKLSKSIFFLAFSAASIESCRIREFALESNKNNTDNLLCGSFSLIWFSFGLILNGSEQTLYGGHFSEEAAAFTGALAKQETRLLGAVLEIPRIKRFVNTASISNYLVNQE